MEKIKMQKAKVLVILGPTSSGKTALSIELAKKYGGEIVSADSRQVYRGLTLGTGKVTNDEMQTIPHHMLDVANPKNVYSVSDYVLGARACIGDIHARGKLPIICGGTAFYIDAVLGKAQLPDVPPNPTLRKKLEQKSAPELFLMLTKLDPARAKNIDPHNPVRLVRAIEIAKALGKVPPLKKTVVPYELGSTCLTRCSKPALRSASQNASKWVCSMKDELCIKKASHSAVCVNWGSNTGLWLTCSPTKWAACHSK